MIMPRPFTYQPPQEPLRVVFKDEDILVLSKPAGLLSVRGKPVDHEDCLEARAKAFDKRARSIHRLDMSTSGLIIFALNPEAHRHISMQFEKRKVEKAYIALVSGIIEQDEGEVNLPLICDWPRRPMQMVDMEQGKPSLTKWKVLERGENITRVLLTPVTGRAHQLRVHMMSLGHSILGDEFYAPEEVYEAADRLLLHASFIRFTHPLTGEVCSFEDQCPF